MLIEFVLHFRDYRTAYRYQQDTLILQLGLIMI